MDGRDVDALAEEEEFLSLDDVVQAGSNIDLPSDQKLQVPSSYSQLTFLPTPLRRGGGEYQRSDFVMNSWAIHQSGAVLLDPHLLTYLADTPGPQKAAQVSPSPAQAPEADGAGDWNQDGGWDDSHIYPAPPAPTKQEYRQPAQAEKPKQILKKKATAWPMLDPHEPGKEKPFKKGVTYKLPALEKAAPKKKPMKVRGLNFPQFAYLHRAERKARSEERAQKRLPEEEGEVEDDEGVDAVEFFGDDWAEPADDWVPEIPVDHEPQLPQDLPDPNEAGDLSSYEDLCRMHVQNYLTKTHLLFKQESKLGQRVQHWTQRIGPILDAQERRPEFDLPVYKAKILEEIQKQSQRQKENRSKKGAVVSAETAIGGVESWDVARKFASMLELVNAGQIELLPGHGSFEVKLLERARAASPVKSSRIRAPKQVLVQ